MILLLTSSPTKPLSKLFFFSGPFSFASSRMEIDSKSTIDSLIFIAREHNQKDAMRSFSECFCDEMDISEFELKQVLRSSLKSYYADVMLHLEFGLHKRLINETNLLDLESNMYPVLFMLSAASTSFRRRIILLCDSNNLAFFHKDLNIINIVPEKYDSDIDPLILTLTDHGVLMNTKLKDEKLIESLKEYSLISTLNLDRNTITQYLDEEYYSENSYKFCSNDVERILEKNTNNNYEIVPIMKFVESYSTTNEDGNLNVLDTAYSNDIRVDFQLSDYRVEAMEDIKYEKSYDLDGFMAILKPDYLASCVNSGGSIVKIEESTFSKAKKSFLKLLSNSGHGEFKDCKLVKFAKLDSPYYQELLVCTAFQGPLESFDIVNETKKAFYNSAKFPCSENDSCKYSKLHQSVATGRPIRTDQFKRNSFTWDYDKVSFHCILSNMSKYLTNVVSKHENIKLFFWIKSFGTKFKLVTDDLSRIPDLVASLTSSLNVSEFLKPGGPRAFIDVSLKFVPKCNSGTTKVHTTDIKISNFLIILNVLVGGFLEREIISK